MDARGAESSIFRANYLAKLNAYPKSGPHDSVRRDVVVEAEELYQYLNKHEPRLVTLWGKDIIYEFALSQCGKVADYEPTKRRQYNSGETLLPCDTCRRCRNRRSGYMDILRPLRCLIREKFTNLHME